MAADFETLRVRQDGAVMLVDIAAPPINLLGIQLVRYLVSLMQRAESDEACHVIVFASADPDYFIPHVDVTRISEYREQAARLTGEPSMAILFRRLSESRLVTIAQVEGRVRGAGSKFVLACDLRFAALESAIFSQPESGFGLIPGAGGIQHLTRLLGRARALDVMLDADDYAADLAERYVCTNRALPVGTHVECILMLAHRIAAFPAAGRAVLKARINAIALAPTDDFARDSDLFLECARDPEAQKRIQTAMTRGFQTHEGELALGHLISSV